MSNCLNCGKPMEMRTVVQLYCSKRCQMEYYRTHKREAIDARWPSITFNCAKCGRTVTTEPGSDDRRTKFCSPECEKKYWRHPPWEVRRTSVWVDRPPAHPKIFACAECGKRVVTNPDEGDRRWRFCCKEHCDKYWHKLENTLHRPSVQRMLAERWKRLSTPFVCKTCGKIVIPAEVPEARRRRAYCCEACARKKAPDAAAS